MSKINKKDFLNDIHQLINESFNEDEQLNLKNIFNIKKSISNLIECASKNEELLSFLNEYQNKLKNGIPDVLLFESYLNGINNLSKKDKNIIPELRNLSETYKNHQEDLISLILLESMQPEVKLLIENHLYNYLNKKDLNSKNLLLNTISEAERFGDKSLYKLSNFLNETSINSILPINKVSGPIIGGRMNESYIEKFNNKSTEINENKLNDIYNKIDNYVEKKLDEAVEFKTKDELENTLSSIINSVKLDEAISRIKLSNANTNKKLMDIVNQYDNALKQGAFQERLYEGFMNNLAPYTYFVPVEEELNRLERNVKSNGAIKTTLTKILEEMQESTSYYLLPLIECDTVRYIKNPTAINRVQLRNACAPFASDPYVNTILDYVYQDDSKAHNLMFESLSMKDQIKLMKENANISSIYSPVQYIKENESIFYVNNSFFVKKGNTISKLNENEISKLDEKFIELTKLVNDKNVQINENSINLQGKDINATIYEKYVEIDGNKETKKSLRNLNEMYMKYGNYDETFFIMASCLLENFNNIANIDFVKHIELNEDENINLDLFNVNNNIYISTNNESLLQHTFYKNVNPIQCKNIINEHMGMNISNMFDNLLPNQEKILNKLNETDDNYKSNIEKYEKMIDKLKDTKDKATSDQDKEKVETTIKDIEDKLENIKKEYKDWQEKADEVSHPKDKDVEDKDPINGEVSADKDKETTDEPIDKKDVKDVLPDLETPLENSDDSDDNNEDDSDEDNDDNEDNNVSDEEDDEEDAELNNDIKSYLDKNQKIEDISTDDEDEDDNDNILDDDSENEADDYNFNTDDNDNSDDFDFDDNTSNDNKDKFGDFDNGEDDNSDDFDFNSDKTSDEYNGEDETDLFNDEEDDDETSPKIVSVIFDENIKTEEKYKSGTIIVLTPKIQSDGTKYTDNENIQFYINDKDEPVIEGEDMNEDLYQKIIDKIKSDPKFEEWVKEGKDKPCEGCGDGFNDDEDEFIIDVPEDNDPVMTYKNDDNTEFELPSPEVDHTSIPENFLSINAEIKNKKGQHFLLNEKKINKVKSKKEYVKLNEDEEDEISDDGSDIDFGSQDSLIGTDLNSNNDIIDENIDPSSLINKLHDTVEETISSLDTNLNISDVSVLFEGTDTPIYLFNIGYGEEPEDSNEDAIEEDENYNIPDVSNYTIFITNGMMSWKDTAEIEETLEDEDSDESEIRDLFQIDNNSNNNQNFVDINNITDCSFILSTILKSLTGESFDIDIDDSDLEKENYDEDEDYEDLHENVKIRKKLSNDFNDKISKKTDEIKNGSKEDKDHQKEIDKITDGKGLETAGQENQGFESFVPKLPNIHIKKIDELYTNEKVKDFEPGEQVTWNGNDAQVVSIKDDGKTIVILCQGMTVEVTKNQIKHASDKNLTAPSEFSKFDKNKVTPIEPSDNTTYKDGKFNDLNKKTINCNIIVDGYRLNMDECKASLKDLLLGKNKIHVINEDNNEDVYPAENVEVLNNPNTDEWPWAVIATSDDEPIRKIQVNPKSYVNASDDEQVECLVNGKLSNINKSVLRILS